MVESLDLKHAKKLLPKRKQESNKATYGKILNIAGSKFYQGAAALSSLSALKIGAGYLTLACPDCILNNIASQVPELTFLPLRSYNNESIAGDNALSVAKKANEYNVISMGCGLTTNSSTIEFVDTLLNKIDPETKLVIDADAINALSILERSSLPKNSILTPHPKELSRLLNTSVENICENRVDSAILAAAKFKSIILLKGKDTVITDGNIVYINKTGNSGLAKAGSGDVLTGIISGLISQGMTLLNASILGCFIHGLSADLAAKDLSEYSILATDLINYIPKAINKILGA